MEKQHLLNSDALSPAESQEDWEAIIESLTFFLGKTPIDAMYEQQEFLYGEWSEELEKVGGITRQGKFSLQAGVPMCKWGEEVGREPSAGMQRGGRSYNAQAGQGRAAL